jgi:hypothetical protein
MDTSTAFIFTSRDRTTATEKFREIRDISEHFIDEVRTAHYALGNPIREPRPVAAEPIGSR